MDDTLKKKVADSIARILEIYNAFCYRFGKDRVDLHSFQVLDADICEKYLQNRKYNAGEDFDWNNEIDHYFDVQILVYWPEVKVVSVNLDPVLEHTITDLYARIDIEPSGRLHEFTMNRASFTRAEWKSKYIHSHLHQRWGMPEFTNPCMGSGPLYGCYKALTTKRTEFVYDIRWWDTFIFELSRYVGIESIDGGPYIRMDSIVDSNVQVEAERDSQMAFGQYARIMHFSRWKNLFRAFLLDFLKQPIPFHCDGLKHCVAMDSLDFWLYASNFFISWINEYHNSFILDASWFNYEEMVKDGLLIPSCFHNGSFYKLSRRSLSSCSDFIDNSTCVVFKGTRQVFRIVDGKDSRFPKNAIHLLNPRFLYRIKSIMQYYVSYYYGYNIKQLPGRSYRR